MKKIVFLFAFLLTVTATFSQKKNVDFKVEKKNKSLVISGLNNTANPLEITLTISGIKGLKGYKGPISKRVEPNSKSEFVTLTYEYEFYDYKLSYTQKKIVTKTKEELAIEERIKNANKADYYLKDKSKINEGIVVFDDDGCGRCRLVTNYLIGNNIDFKIISIANNPENTKLMWKTIKEKKASMKVKAPVIIVDGKLSHSHTDLEAFLKGLK